MARILATVTLIALDERFQNSNDMEAEEVQQLWALHDYRI